MRLRSARLLAWLAVAALGILGVIAEGAMRPAKAQQDEVTVEFRETLGPFGQWRPHPRWGEVWLPADVPPDWRPYRTGHWVYTDEWGWYWVADEEWGWVTYHYGRWIRDRELGWGWIPGRDWSPAWVRWRHGDEAVGWQPMPPDEVIAEIEEDPDTWLFVAPADLIAPAVAVVLLPPPQAVVFFRQTVVVSQTIVVTNRNRVIVTNPGIAPSIIARRIGRPIATVALQPRVFRHSAGLVSGAIVGRPPGGRFREVVTVQPRVIRPALTATRPVPFRVGQPYRPGPDAPNALRRVVATSPSGVVTTGPSRVLSKTTTGPSKVLSKTTTVPPGQLRKAPTGPARITTTTTGPTGPTGPTKQIRTTPPNTVVRTTPPAALIKQPPPTVRRAPAPATTINRPPPQAVVRTAPTTVNRPPPVVNRPPPVVTRAPAVVRAPPAKKCTIVNGKQVCQ